MGKRREKHPFEDPPFVDGLLEYMDSPEGQLSIEASYTLYELMENVQLDARRRELVWPRAQRLSFDASVERIQKMYPRFPAQRIQSFLISCLLELDQLTEPWIVSKKRDDGERTRDS